MKLIGPASRRLRELSRRGFLRNGSGLAAALLSPGLVGLAIKQSRGAGESGMDMQGHAGAGSRGVTRAPFQKGAPLIEPEVRRSVNGELRTTLQARYAHKDIGGYRLFLRTYDGMIPGPTLRVRPGDVLRIRLINDLPPNPDPVPLDMALPHHFNTTNFHVHGSHVSPEGISDNIFRSMEPGQSYDIEIAVPRDHTSGTYWYHPHHHGSADVQITGGMAGALIVEGDFDDVPEVAGVAERVLLLNEVLFDYRGTIEVYDTVWPEACHASSPSMDNGSPPFACGPARSNVGGLFTPATRTTFTSLSRNMLCTPLPLTASEDHGSIISKVCFWRRVSVPTCWCRPERSALTLFARYPMTRVTPRPSDRLPESSSMVSRFRCRSPPRLVERRSLRSAMRRSPRPGA